MGSIGRVYQARMTLARARLELAGGGKKRVAVLEEAVAVARENEKAAAVLDLADRVSTHTRPAVWRVNLSGER